MRILYIISGDVWGGAEAQASSLILGLQKLSFSTLNVILFNYGRLATTLHQKGVPINIIPEAGGTSAQIVYRCFRYVRALRPDIVHVHGFKENLLGGLGARFGGAKAIIRTFHGMGLIGARIKYDAVEKINAFFLSNAIIAVSEDLKKRLTSLGFPKRKIMVIHNGVLPVQTVSSQKIATLKNSFMIPSDVSVIGTVGRLVAVKDHKTFLDGAKIILRTNKKTRFIIVGDGPMKSELEAYANSIGIENEVCFAGFRTNIADFLGMFDIFAMTSLHEGIPMALLEAMSLSKPVIVTKVGGIPEIVKDSTSGILIPPRNPDALAEACLKVLADTNLVRKLGTRAMQAIQEHYSIEFCVNKTKKLYETVLN